MILFAKLVFGSYIIITFKMNKEILIQKQQGKYMLIGDSLKYSFLEKKLHVSETCEVLKGQYTAPGDKHP